MESKNKLLLALFIVGLIAVAGCAPQKTNGNNQISGKAIDGVAATIFKSSGCGCCGVYSQYMEKKGFNVQVVDTEDLDSVKSKYKIPVSMQSCHTTVVGDYFVEGHVPAEAIEKLLAEKPDIAGIAMPGMPSGSPGMPGSKRGPFIVYAVNKDGSTAEFMRI